MHDKKRTLLERVEKGFLPPFEAAILLEEMAQIGAGRKKGEGVVYTPEAMAKQMVELCAPKIGESILEPSCGRGVFVFAIAERWIAESGAHAAHQALAKDLLAIDLDAAAIDDLKLLWTAYWRSKGIEEPAPPRAIAQDALFGQASQERFDLSIGNPPYVRFQNLEDGYRSRLAAGFETCRSGNVDIYFAFVEMCARQSSRGCLVFPNSWMSSASGKGLRELLAGRALKIADYGGELPFAPVRAYVCVALFSGAERQDGGALSVQNGGLDCSKPWLDFPKGDGRVGPKGWRLAQEAPKTPSSRVLGDIATLSSGIATLADGCYAIKGARIEKGRALFHDELCGRELSIRVELAPKKAKLTKASGAASLRSLEERILRPYRPDGSLIPFAELEASDPDAAAFLLARKAALAERDKGKQEGYPEWHAYGRKQGLRELPDGELCAVKTMSEGRIECFGFSKDDCGNMLFTSGFVLAPKAPATRDDLLAALRHPDSWAWALSHGKPWAGAAGKTYRSLGAKLLLSMPLPEGDKKEPAPKGADY